MTSSKEHDARYWKYRDYIHMFPLTQFKFKNPCNRCLVRPSCTKACDDYYKYTDLNIMFSQRLEIIKNFFLIMIGLIFEIIHFIMVIILMLIVCFLTIAGIGIIIISASYLIELWYGILT